MLEPCNNSFVWDSKGTENMVNMGAGIRKRDMFSAT